MFEGWRWRYSRDLEVQVMFACVVINSSPFREEAVTFKELIHGWPLYKAD